MSLASTPKQERFFILLALLPLVLIPLLVVPGLIDVGLTPRFIGLAGMVIIAAAGLLEKATRKEKVAGLRELVGPASLFYLAYIGWISLRLIFSPNFSEALFDWQRTVLLFSFMLVFSAFFTPRGIPYAALAKMVSLLAIGLVGLGAVQLALLLTGGEITHHLTYHIKLTFGHRNLYAQFLLLTLPFSLMGLVVLKKFWRLISGFAVVLVLAGITFLLARSVWVSLGTTTGIVLVLALIFRKQFTSSEKENTAKWPRFVALGLMLGVIGFTALLYTKADSLETLLKTGKEMGDMKYGSPKERIIMWKASWEMFKDHPVAGTGLSSWKTEFPAYGLSGLRPEAEAGEHHFQRPHNDFFWVLTESGLIGFLLWMGIFVFTLWGLIQTIRQHPDREARIFALLMIFGILSYLGVSFFSFPRERMEHGLYLHVMLGCGLMLRYQWKQKTVEFPAWLVNFAYLALILLSVGCLFTGWFRMQGEYFTNRTLVSRAQKELHQVTFEADAALSPFYKMDPSSTPLYWYKGESFFLMGDFEKAKEAFEQSLALHPNHIHVLNNLASTLVKLDQPNAAKAHYRKALEISTSFEEAHLNLAAVLYTENPDSSWLALSQVPEQYGDARYLQSVDMVTAAATFELAQEMQNEPLKELILRIHFDPEWRLNLHKKAIKDALDYKVQVLLDAVYVLETIDKTLTFEEAEKLRIDYQLNTEKNP